MFGLEDRGGWIKRELVYLEKGLWRIELDLEDVEIREIFF